MKKRDEFIENMIRLYRGGEELSQKPYKAVGGVLIFMLFAVVWKHKDVWFTIPFLPTYITDILQYVVSILLIMCVAVLLLVWIKYVGIHSLEEDENNLKKVFSEEELRNGNPKLISRRYVKGTDVEVRRYYSYIDIKRWEVRRSELEYQMSATFVKPYIEKGGKRQIIIYTIPDDKKKDKDILYDDI